MKDRAKVVTLELVPVAGGPAGIQLRWAGSGQPVGVGLFANEDVAKEYARKRGWRVAQKRRSAAA